MKLSNHRRLRFISKSKSQQQPDNRFCCPLCGSHHRPLPFPVALLESLHRYQFKHNILLTETVNFAHYVCSNCQATDRDRFYCVYLENWLSEKKGSKKLLEIGPSAPLRKWLTTKQNIIYRSADLYRSDVDDNVDITNMHVYANNSFDIVICSHVLEHVGDDRAAMRELNRILHPNGIAIIMVPINIGVMVTEEDPECEDIPTRWHLFGQDDHIRMYSKSDFIDRLKQAAFNVEQLGISYFGKSLFERHAIFPTSVLYACSKSK